MYQVALRILEVEPLRARSRTMEIITDLTDFYTFVGKFFVGCR
jgi:hypothetical protein